MRQPEALEILQAALPASGAVTYEALEAQIREQKNDEALKYVQRLKRAGQLGVFIENQDGKRVLMVSRNVPG